MLKINLFPNRLKSSVLRNPDLAGIIMNQNSNAKYLLNEKSVSPFSFLFFVHVLTRNNLQL